MSSDMDDSKPSYFNIKYNGSGSPVVDNSKSPDKQSARIHPYINVPIPEPGHSPSLQCHSPVQNSPEKKVPSPTKSVGGAETSPLRRYASESGFQLSGKEVDHKNLKSKGHSSSPLTAASPSVSAAKQAMANAKFDLLTQQGSGASCKSCEKCEELMNLLASWQIGAGSLMRNYSRILSLLMQTRDSALALECRLNEQYMPGPRPSSAPPTEHQFVQVTAATAAAFNGRLLSPSSATPVYDGGHSSKGTAATISRGPVVGVASSPVHAKKGAKNRQSVFASSTGTAHACGSFDFGENMYPKREGEVDHLVGSRTVPAAVASNPATYTKDIEELKKNLWGAIDLCQQLAAACFKKTHLTTPGNSEFKDKPTAQTQLSAPQDSVPLSSSSPSADFMRKHSEGTLPQITQYKSSLQTIKESKMRDRKRKKEEGGLQRVTSAPSLECSSESMTSSGEKDVTSAVDEEGYVHVTAEGIPDSVTKTADAKPTGKVVMLAGGGARNRAAASDSVDGEESSGDRTRRRTSSWDDTESESASDRGVSPVSGGDKDQGAETVEVEGAEMVGGERTVSMLSDISTYTDSDVKYVMSKIASLEEERYRLLETIDKLHSENSNVS